MAGKKKKRRERSLEALEERFLNVLATPAGEERGGGAEAPGEAAARDTVAAAGSLELRLRQGEMRAELLMHGPGAYTAADLFDFLKEQRVVHGIDRAAVEVAASLIAEHGTLPRAVVVARGTPPQPAEEVVFHGLSRVVDPATGNVVWMVDGAPLFNDLPGILANETREAVNAMAEVAVKAVAKGECIARLRRRADARPGVTVTGREFDDPGWRPQTGDNIVFDKASGEYRARVYGYLHADGDMLDVVPPVWIARDRMAAYWLCLPQIGEPVLPQYADISSLLLGLHIRPKFLLSKRIHALCGKMAQGQRLPVTVKVAQGQPPVPGEPGRFVLHVDTEVRAGTLREDDTMDLRERNIVAAVAEGHLVAEKIKPTRGKPGADLFGQEIPAPDGKDVMVKVDKGVKKEEDEERIRYYAAYNGNVTFRYNTLTVVRVFNISGDVDYETGNVRVKTDLAIGGSIRPGFTVEADGNVQVGGMVEPGATVHCSGNLVVAKGIMGEETSVTASGDVTADFIQDAEVIAGGEVVVGSYVFNSMVRAGRTISVRKTSSAGGKVIGGLLVASRGIEAAVVGSPTNRSTVVSIQPTVEHRAQERKLEGELRECRETISKIMRTLQLDSVDPRAIKAKLERVPKDRRELYSRLLVNLSALIKKKNLLESQRRELAALIEAELAKATIRVSSEFFQGNEVRFGDKRFVAPNDLGPCVFQLHDGHIRR